MLDGGIGTPDASEIGPGLLCGAVLCWPEDLGNLGRSEMRLDLLQCVHGACQLETANCAVQKGAERLDGGIGNPSEEPPEVGGDEHNECDREVHLWCNKDLDLGDERLKVGLSQPFSGF